MKKLLTVITVGEAAMGVAFLTVPSLVSQFLFGAGLTGTGVTMARLAGIALIALCVACWTGTPLVGMLTYSALAVLYLLYLGFRGEWIGPLLWPAVVLHVILTFLLAWRGALQMKTNPSK